MLVRGGSGFCTRIYRSTPVPFRIGSMFSFCFLCEICHCSRAQSMSPCLWHMFLFQLPIISSIVKQQKTTGTTRLGNWRGSSTVCYRRSRLDPLCRLWSSGMNMCCPIIEVCSNFRWGVSGRDTGVGRTQQDRECVLEAGIPTRCP